MFWYFAQQSLQFEPADEVKKKRVKEKLKEASRLKLIFVWSKNIVCAVQVLLFWTKRDYGNN